VIPDVSEKHIVSKLVAEKPNPSCHGNFKFQTHCSMWLENDNSSEILLGYRIVEETVRTARVFVEAEVKRTGGSERWNRIGRRGSEEEKEEGMIEQKLWTETELGWCTGL